MEVRVLGPVDVVDDSGRPTAVAGMKHRTTLATLALNGGRVVPVDRLVDIAWGEEPPRTARRQVLNCMSVLRRVLGAAVVTAPSGYLLDTGRVAVDATRFEASVARGREAVSRGRTEEATRTLDAGLAVWRGPALAGTAGLNAQAARLEDMRLGVVEERAALRLTMDVTGLAAELTGLVAEHPHREGLVSILMLALYRSGRQAEALETYRRTLATLGEDFGIGPGPRLRHLHEAILRGDPTLEPPSGPDSALRAGVHCTACRGRSVTE